MFNDSSVVLCKRIVENGNSQILQLNVKRSDGRLAVVERVRVMKDSYMR